MTKHTGKIFILLIIAAAAFFSNRCAADVEEVYITPHFHYDPVFEKDQNDYTDIGFDRCRRFMSALKEDPDYAVVFSEIDYLKPFFDTYTEEREPLLRFITENRIETGGSYSEPNEPSVGGEGLIRNIVYGRAYHEDVLGDRNALVYQPWDVFGHSLQLTQILKKTRYIGAMWRKGNPPTEGWVGITVPGLTPDFLNLAPDGSLLHHRREHYKAISGTNSEEDLADRVNRKKTLQDSLGLSADFSTLSSADFAYPEPWLAGHCTSLKNRKPPIIISGPTAYMRKIQSSDLDRLPVIARDFSLYHVGTALSRVNLKIGNRLGENAALGAEKFGTVAALLGARYPAAAIDKAWRQLIFNQHHDGITGTCNDRSYFDMIAGYRESLELSTRAYRGALDFIASATAPQKDEGVITRFVVFNQLGWIRSDVTDTGYLSLPDIARDGNYILKDSAGAPAPFSLSFSRDGRAKFTFVARDVLPMGYKTYYLYKIDGSEKTSPAISAAENTIENEFYSVTVDPARGGTITKLVDKQTGRVVFDSSTKYPGNELIVLQEDAGPHYVAWELSTSGEKGFSSRNDAEVKAEIDGASARLTVTGEIPDLGGYSQEIILYPGVKRIDFVTTLLDPAATDDPADRNLWLVRFPAELNGTAPVVEDRFYAAARRRSLKPLNYRTDLDKMHTLSAPYSADRWAEEGTAVRVDILDRDNAAADALSIMLCEIVHSRSADSIAAARELQRALITRGVACTPSFDDEDRNKDLLNRNFRFVLDIAGDSSFAQSLLSKGKAAEKYAERLGRDGAARLLVSARSNDLEIRGVDTLMLGAADAAAMNKMIGELAASITSTTRIELAAYEDARGAKNPAPPDDYGIALINRGNLLHSFDDNGTIVMGLFHSAPWAMTVMDTPFPFPERKTHRFEYSLYPHAGDWRAARTYRAGHEVNSPLVAVATQSSGGDAPDSAAFFDIETGSAVLSAIKPLGNPLAAMKTGAARDFGPHNGVVMRFYEAEGKNETVRVKFFMPLAEAWFANMLEEKTADAPTIGITNGDTITFDIGPNAIETIVVIFKDAPPPGDNTQQIAPDAEPYNIIYSRYWDYNLGAAYMNNSPVTVDLDFPLDDKPPDPEMIRMGLAKEKPKKFKKGENELRLSVTNNSADEPLSGRLIVRAPDGWTPDPADIRIELAPMESRLIPLKVDAGRPVKSGFVRAALQVGGEVYFDVLRIGDAVELEAEAAVVPGETADTLRVSIRNSLGDLVYGVVTPVGPVETWPAALSGNLSLVELTPRLQHFMLNPDEETALEFNIAKLTDLPDHYWLMVKITFNGEFSYIPVNISK